MTRNRPWFDATVQDMTLGGAVIIQDPQKLKFFPDVNAVLGGLSLDAYLAQGGVRSLFMIPVLDLRLARSILLGGARRLELFLEMFNLPNFVDLTGGNNNMNAASFLVRTTARDPRQLQWAARYVF